MGIPQQHELIAPSARIVTAHAHQILQMWQEHVRTHPESPQQAVLQANDNDVKLSLFGSQGSSRLTFLVEAAGEQAILSVNIPNPQRLYPRASHTNRIEFRQHLRERGIPIPEKIGTPFTLPELPYQCEMTCFCHGYQLRSGVQPTDTELLTIADVMGRIHTSGYQPKGLHAPLRQAGVLLRQLPHGFVHGDLSRGNLIFDPETHRLNGLIDFEWAQDKCFVDELSRVLRHYALVPQQTPEGTTVVYAPERVKLFLDAYEKHRPLTSAEKQALPKCMANELVKAQRAHARGHSGDHSAGLLAEAERAYAAPQPAR